MGEVVLEVSGTQLTPQSRALLLRDAQKVTHGRSARFGLQVKSSASKKLVQVRAKLIAGKQVLFSGAEGRYIDTTCMHAVRKLGSQFQRQTI